MRQVPLALLSGHAFRTEALSCRNALDASYHCALRPCSTTTSAPRRRKASFRNARWVRYEKKPMTVSMRPCTAPESSPSATMMAGVMTPRMIAYSDMVWPSSRRIQP